MTGCFGTVFTFNRGIVLLSTACRGEAVNAGDSPIGTGVRLLLRTGRIGGGVSIWSGCRSSVSRTYSGGNSSIHGESSRYSIGG